MGVRKKELYPRYSNEEYLDGLKHLVLSKKQPTPELINAVSESVSKVIGAECKIILARADARIAAAQERAYKSQGDK